MMLLFYSCSEETTKVDLPTSAIIHYSVVDKQVAFTALAHSADTYSWDFGDGETSSDPNPVHVYETGYYTATLTVTGTTGTDSDEVDLTIGAPPIGLLTGGPFATEGKTWRIANGHSDFDYFAYADPDLNPFPGTPVPLPAGIFGAGLGMGEVYSDEFTFYFDGRYKVDVKDDNAAFSGIVHQLLNGGTIVNDGGSGFGLVTALYTPDENATFTMTESEDFVVLSAIAGGPITFSDAMTLDFSGTSYLGFLDLHRKVIVQELTNTRMRIAVFASLDPGAYSAGAVTNAIVLTFEVVN